MRSSAATATASRESVALRSTAYRASQRQAARSKDPGSRSADHKTDPERIVELDLW